MLCRDCFSENNLAFYILPVKGANAEKCYLGDQDGWTNSFNDHNDERTLFFYWDSRKSNIDKASTKKSSNEWQEWIRKKLSHMDFPKRAKKFIKLFFNNIDNYRKFCFTLASFLKMKVHSSLISEMQMTVYVCCDRSLQSQCVTSLLQNRK